MITERTLKRWRGGMLRLRERINSVPDYNRDPKTDQVPITRALLDEFMKNYLRMTQELLDQHLLRK